MRCLTACGSHIRMTLCEPPQQHHISAQAYVNVVSVPAPNSDLNLLTHMQLCNVNKDCPPAGTLLSASLPATVLILRDCAARASTRNGCTSMN